MFRRTLRHPQRELLSFLKPSAIVRLLEWLSYKARNLRLVGFFTKLFAVAETFKPVLF
jgi:hypothetical protein